MTRSAAVLILVSIAAVSAGSAPTVGADLAAKAEAVLRTHCFRCHGEQGVAEGGFGDVLSHSRLVRTKKVVAGDLEGSLLWNRVNDDVAPMPPEEEAERPSADDVATLRAWIEAGVPAFGASSAPRDFVSPERVVEAIREDLAAAPPRARRFYRYLTLTHLHNGGVSDTELESYRRGLSKLVNSLSWEREVAQPTSLGPHESVVRIDLRDYGWDDALWDEILFEYPLGVLYGTEAEAQGVAMSRTRMPYVRGDWFVFEASKPPLYHRVLRLPERVEELERQLQVNVERNIEQGRARRAGFSASGVSAHNRMIERHPSSYGAYWKSYDFAGSAALKNLFSHPLGPGEGLQDFRHDGGEVIFNLPNGLQGYLLIDADGRRIDRGPIEIVSDPKRVDRQVVNGVSCMTCHAGGLIPKNDQVLAHVRASRARFSDDERQRVESLYAEREEMKRWYDGDSARHQEAVRRTGAPLSETEPVAALARQFEKDVDLSLLAAELGLTPEEFLKAIPKFDSVVRAAGAIQQDGATVKRDVVLEQVMPFSDEFGGRRLVRSRRRVEGQTPVIEAKSRLALARRVVNVRYRENGPAAGTIMPVWRFDDPEADAWLFVSGGGAMAAVRRGETTDDATIEPLYSSVRFMPPTAELTDAGWASLEEHEFQVVRDSGAGVVLYVTNRGRLAVVRAPKPDRRIESLQRLGDTLNRLTVRGATEEYLSPDSPQVLVEGIRDANLGVDLVFSSRGSILATTLLDDRVLSRSEHGYALDVRLPGVERFNGEPRRVRVELKAQRGMAFYVADSGDLAPAPTAVASSTTVQPVWRRGHEAPLPSVDGVGDETDSELLSIEVYEDPNARSLIYVNHLGGIATIPLPE